MPDVGGSLVQNTRYRVLRKHNLVHLVRHLYILYQEQRVWYWYAGIYDDRIGSGDRQCSNNPEVGSRQTLTIYDCHHQEPAPKAEPLPLASLSRLRVIIGHGTAAASCLCTPASRSWGAMAHRWAMIVMRYRNTSISP